MIAWQLSFLVGQSPGRRYDWWPNIEHVKASWMLLTESPLGVVAAISPDLNKHKYKVKIPSDLSST